VRWGEFDVSGLERSQVFDRVSLLTQDFQRWPVTAAMNIRIGRPGHDASMHDLQTSVDYAGAGSVTAKLPNGLDSMLGRMFRGTIELSGGEWQKVGLARTHWRSSTSQEDSVLIVDEPTSALDPEAEIAAFDRIRRLAAPHRAVVLVTY
jgi:ATP-binding cassette subfamily B protein